MPLAPSAILAAILLALAAAPAAAQSFSCSGSLQPDERAVCDSGKLSALDDEMSALYHDIETHALMGVSGETRDSQRAFLTERASCGADDACIERLYHHRIAELRKTKEAVGQGAAN